jgi:hypothetical protein
VPNGPEDLRPSGFSFQFEVRPNSLRQLASKKSRTDGKHARHRRKVADVAVHHAEQRADGFLVGRDGVEIAHNSSVTADPSEWARPSRRGPTD